MPSMAVLDWPQYVISGVVLMCGRTIEKLKTSDTGIGPAQAVLHLTTLCITAILFSQLRHLWLFTQHEKGSKPSTLLEHLFWPKITRVGHSSDPLLELNISSIDEFA